MITRNFDIYLNAGVAVAPVINVNQYDHDEQWIFTLYEENGEVYVPSTGAIVGVKSDKHGIVNSATVNQDGQVVINETQQMTASAGTAIFELMIDNQTHGTANFRVEVEKKPGDMADYSESDLSFIQRAIDAGHAAEQAAADAQQAYEDTAELAETAQQDIEDARDAALGNIQQASTTAQTAIDNAKTSALSDINTAKTTAVSDINTAKTTAVSDIGTARTTALNDINSAKTTAVSDVNQASTTAQTAISTAQQTGVSAVNQASTTAQSDINTAKTTAISDVQQTAATAQGDLEDIVDEASAQMAQSVTTAQQAATSAQQAATEAETLVDGAKAGAEMARHKMKNIRSIISNLPQAVAEQDLGKYGYSIGDYFNGPSGYCYFLADLDTFFAQYYSEPLWNKHHLAMLVIPPTQSKWKDTADTSTGYKNSTLQSTLVNTIYPNVNSDFKELFGGADNEHVRNTLWKMTSSNSASSPDYARIVALTENQVFGSRIFTISTEPADESYKQLEIFRKYHFALPIYMSGVIAYSTGFWLRNIHNSTQACFADVGGYAYPQPSYGAANGNKNMVGLIIFK